MYSVYQHWDTLEVCLVGRSYPPEYYSWIKNSRLRQIFENIAEETEQDFQKLISKLKEFNVEILRPDVDCIPGDPNFLSKPPVAVRDHMIMIGNKFYSNIPCYDFGYFYYNIKKSNWPHCDSFEQINKLPDHIKNEIIPAHDQYKKQLNTSSYQHIFDHITKQGNEIKTYIDPHITGPMVSRIGKDLYFGTYDYNQDVAKLKTIVDDEFIHTRNHVVNTGGHSDGTYCPVSPGLIISLYDVPTYAETFPEWEVVYLPKSNLIKNQEFFNLKQKNQGRWWIPGFEQDQQLIDTVETYLKHWLGFVEETVFDVNMLIIDPKNVIVFNYNSKVFNALSRYGITAHVVPFRHRYFWDGGVHCITNDLSRRGRMQNYFPKRK